MGRKKGCIIVVPKGKAALYLEDNYALNFDDVTQDTLFTKGNILYYLIDHTVLNVADKLAPLLTSDDKKTLYARIHQLQQKHHKKHSRDLKNERYMKNFETFCLQSFMVNSHPTRAAQDPQLMNTEHCANKGFQRQQCAATAQAGVVIPVTDSTATSLPATPVSSANNPPSPAKTRHHNLWLFSKVQQRVITSNKETIQDLRSEISNLKSTPLQKIIKNLNVSTFFY